MKALLPLIIFFKCVTCFGQSSDFTTNANRIFIIAAEADSAKRADGVAKWFEAMRQKHIPVISDDSVLFIYQGKASTVAWMGDFNGWGYDKAFKNKGKRVPGTDLWILRTAFPKNSRLDYKILIDGNSWILDPQNDDQQWSGVGGGSPNSELRMPDWKQDPIQIPREDIAHGKIITDLLLFSKTLGYQITYTIYLPPGINKSEKLPSLYVTDGYEYLHPKLGNMVTVLDNLLADKKIKPLIVIFVDQREPVDRSHNKRMEELAMNPKYLAFFENELIPLIESQYPVLPDAGDRGIMGASMGGLNAAYFGFSKPGVFGLVGIQSPAFAVRPQIYAVCNNPIHPVKVSMTTGLMSDASDASRKMGNILQTNACVYNYHEVNDGHSWGNWKNLIDDVLIDLGKK